MQRAVKIESDHENSTFVNKLWRWRERLKNAFEGNIKMYWKEVNRVRNGAQVREEMVKDVNKSNIAGWC